LTPDRVVLAASRDLDGRGAVGRGAVGRGAVGRGAGAVGQAGTPPVEVLERPCGPSGMTGRRRPALPSGLARRPVGRYLS